MLTKNECVRRSAIIKELSRLSRDGWVNATREEYLPLERELDALNEKRENATTADLNMTVGPKLSHKNEFAHRMLTEEGSYTHEHVEADFDDGDPENGPGCWGYPAYDVYHGDSHDIVIDHTGLIVDMVLIDWDLCRWFEAEEQLSLAKQEKQS